MDLVSNHFAKLSECDASSRRFDTTRDTGEKRCEHAPHSQSVLVRNLVSL